MQESLSCVIARRVREAREALELSQAQLAAQLGLHRPSITEIEAGRRHVSSIELARLSEILSRPMSYFLGDQDSKSEMQPDLVSLMLRAEAADATLKPSLAAAVSFARRYRELEQLILDEPAAEIAEYSYVQPRFGQGERVADQERHRLELGNSPVADLVEILESIGVKVIHKPLGRKVSGAFFVSEQTGPCIVVNTAHNLARQRFTLAHEYGHCVMDGREHARVSPLTQYNARDEVERRADLFAAAFLAPAHGVVDFFGRLHIDKGSELRIEDVLLASRYFGMSHQAMTHRFFWLGWLDRKNRSYILSMSPRVVAKNLRIEAPSDDTPAKREHRPHVLTARFIRLALEAYRSKKLTTARLAELLGQSAREVRLFLGQHGMALHIGVISAEEAKQEIESA